MKRTNVYAPPRDPEVDKAEKLREQEQNAAIDAALDQAAAAHAVAMEKAGNAEN